MQTIVYYISGHGYGHATRSLELIRTLQSLRRELFFHIRSDAPEWMVKLNLTTNYTLYPVKLDVGVVQKTSFVIDKEKTYRRVAALYERKDQIVKREADFAKAHRARLIIADIPPLAFDVAEAMDIPGVALANFSWDWIYQDYVTEIPELAEVIAQIKSSYHKTTLLLRLPFYGDLSAFPKVTDIPLIARKASIPKEEIWKRFGIDPKNRPKLALVAFRATDLAEVNFKKLEALDEFKFITLGLPKTFKNNINLPPNFIRFPELVHASDVVISKPGYGLVSDILANRTPLLYTSRDDFAEYECLVRGLNEFAVANELPRDDFLGGNWERYLIELLNKPPHWKEISINGAVRAAEVIVKFLN